MPSLAKIADAAIWERAIQFEGGISPTAARALLELRFSEQDLQPMRDLAARARSGTLTPQEQVQINSFEQVSCVLDILHSKARQALKNRQASVLIGPKKFATARLHSS